jgi:phosphatidate cytidylyltransferase
VSGLVSGSDAGDVTTARKGGRNLPVAAASALVLAGVFLATVFLQHWAFLVFVAVLVVIALLELDAAFRRAGIRPATPVAVVAGLVALFGAYAIGPPAQAIALVVLVLGALAWTLVDAGGRQASRGAGVVVGLGATFLITLWVPFLASFIGLLLLREAGTWIVVATVGLSALSDVGAYFVGSRFGRRRLAPSVSPAKTWEGFAGGIGTSLVAAGAVVAWLPGFDLPTALLLAVVVAAMSTVGDLAESMAKRDLGVKDLGRIVPGHGGIMDRVDAIIFALPAAHLLFLSLGR